MSPHEPQDPATENPLDALAQVEPGYVEITRPDGAVDYLLVNDFKIGPDFIVSVGFASDRLNADGSLGKPVFLHKRMQIRHLGSADEYLRDPLVQQIIALVNGHYPADKGLMPLMRTVEMVRSGQVLLTDAPELVAVLLS